MELRIRLDEGVEAPSYAHKGDAGLDLRAKEDVTVFPREIHLVPTGVYAEIPKGYVGMLYLRSGWATKHHVMLANGTGIIDSGYRGEIKIPLSTRDGCLLGVKKGERIAQLVITKIPEIDVVVVDELSDTERGEGGFGSSGRF